MQAIRLAFPAHFQVHGDQYLIKFRDWPEANTCAPVGDQYEAYMTAQDCLLTAYNFRIRDKEALPAPSPQLLHEHEVEIITTIDRNAYLAARNPG